MFLIIKTELTTVDDFCLKQEPESARKLLSQDDMFKYGSADPELLPSTVPCGKCGAHLHCQVCNKFGDKNDCF